MKRHHVGRAKRKKEYVFLYGWQRQYRATTKTKHEAMHAAEEIHTNNGEPTQVLEKTGGRERVIHSF